MLKSQNQFKWKPLLTIDFIRLLIGLLVFTNQAGKVMNRSREQRKRAFRENLRRHLHLGETHYFREYILFRRFSAFFSNFQRFLVAPQTRRSVLALELRPAMFPFVMQRKGGVLHFLVSSRHCQLFKGKFVYN